MRRFYRRLKDPKVNVPIVFVAAIFMAIMDSTIVTVALPALSKQFGVSSTSVDAIIVAYLVSLAVIIPVSGWLGDRWGTKRVFLFALVFFSVASALCGLAQDLLMLVGFRILQGLAGGALTPVGTTLLYRTFPPEERVRVSRILNIPTSIAPAVGPVIGGFFVQQLSWRWIFFVNVPIGLAAWLFGWLFLHTDHPKHATGRFDVLGFVLAGLGLALTMYAFTEGPNVGWTPSIYGSLLVGLLLLGLLVIVELRQRAPMLDLRLYKERLFRTLTLVFLFAIGSFIGLLFVLPLFLQEARGVSPLISGLTTFPEALGLLVSTQIVGHIYPRIGPRRLVLAGQLGVVVVLGLLVLVNLTTNLWLIRILMFFAGVAIAYTLVPVQAAAFANISPAATGKASALYNAQRQIGSALGVAAVGSVLKIVGPVGLNAHGIPQANLAAYRAAFLTSAIIALIAAGLALFVRDKDAASTMQRAARTQDIPTPSAYSAAFLVFAILVLIVLLYGDNHFALQRRKRRMEDGSE